MSERHCYIQSRFLLKLYFPDLLSSSRFSEFVYPTHIEAVESAANNVTGALCVQKGLYGISNVISTYRDRSQARLPHADAATL